MQGTSLEELEEFAVHLEQVVDDRLNEESGSHKRDVFVQVVSEYLIEDGTLEDLDVCYYLHRYGRSHMEVCGYAISDDGRVLDLVVADYGNCGETITREQVKKGFRRAELFAEACRGGHHQEMDESIPEFDMVQKIHSQWSNFDKVRVFLLTDGRSTFDKLDRLPQSKVGGVPVVQDLWDIERIRRLVTSGRREEPISVDFTELGGPLPCLSAPVGDDGYQCLLTVIPGQVLAEMYERYGAKLLQRNVRSFLQLRGKVNKGINETIRKSPERFLAYNNGISATATGVEFDREGTRIVRLDDLQIVNGGQTTASLHHAAKRNQADLSRVWVTAKITVVRVELLDELVPNISRYANSQNTIKEADFEANSPFHVELERASRRVWAPAPEGSTRQTRWYYERARGQYDVDKSRRPTAAQKRAFAAEYPKQQRFTKTDAAKYEMTFRQEPHVVSLGAQKCFQRWTADVVSRFEGFPDDEYFRGLVAKRILFEGTRNEINRLNRRAGYLANVTTYTLARLVEDIDLEKVLTLTWRQQRVPDEVLDAVRELSGPVRGVLLDAPGAGNVTEWCKKEDCWKRVLDLEWRGLSPTIARY